MSMKRTQRQWPDRSSYHFRRIAKGAPIPLTVWSSCMTWQKRRKYQPQFLLNFQNWCYTRSLYTENEKPNLIDSLSNFTNPFIPPCDGQVCDVDDLFWFRQHAPCCDNSSRGSLEDFSPAQIYYNQANHYYVVCCSLSSATWSYFIMIYISLICF